jgi:hypothetical protein
MRAFAAFTVFGPNDDATGPLRGVKMPSVTVVVVPEFEPFELFLSDELHALSEPTSSTLAAATPTNLLLDEVMRFSALSTCAVIARHDLRDC